MASGRDMEPEPEDFENVDNKLLTERDLSDVQSAVYSLRAKYYEIGISLGIEAGDLDAIKHDYQRCEEAWIQTLSTWLKQNFNVKRHGHPSWRRLVLAIKIHNRALAVAIANEHSIATSNLDLSPPPTKRQKIMLSSTTSHYSSTPTNNIDYLEYLTQTLRDSYSKLSTDMWPPLRSVPFVELVLVQIGTESLHLSLTTIKGNISDEILGRKTTVTLDRVLEDVEYGSLVLFEGRPGCGKTTLLIKIAHDWANKRIFEQKLVVLVRMRQLNGKENICLQDLLGTACSALSQNNIEFLTTYIEHNSEDVILIFDGFDEYTPGINEKNFISKIILKKCLFKSTVMVSSRPAATYRFRHIAAKWIEVVGFQNKEITEFVKCYFSNDAEKGQMLVKHLEEHQTLMNLCYLPLHCVMIIHFHRCGYYPLPITKSSFFKQFILSILYRPFHKRKLVAHNNIVDIPKELSSFEELPYPYLNIFYDVCELAFHATIESKQVFTLTELKDIGLSLNINHGDLDLLVIDCYFVMSGVGESYTFLHLTLQQYLAAVHVSRCDDAHKMEIVSNHGGKQHLEVMWTLLCGIIDYRNPIMQNLFKEIINLSNSTTFHMQCAYESQNMSMCTHVFQRYSSRFTFDNIESLDLTPLIYVLKNVNTEDTIHLHLKECSFPCEDSTVQFLREISNYHLSLEISYGQAVKSVLDALGSPAITMDKLINLEIIGDHEVLESSTVTGLNKCISIQTLKVSWINIGNSVNSAFKCIRWRTLKTLDLGWCNLRSKLTNILAERLQYLPNLTCLDICQNSIGDDAAGKLIHNILKYCKNLQELNLDSNALSDDSVSDLRELIVSAEQLRELKLVINTRVRSKKENRFSPSGWKRLITSKERREGMIPLNITGKPLLYRKECTDSKNSDVKELTYIHS